jgi:hypothetical protein
MDEFDGFFKGYWGLCCEGRVSARVYIGMYHPKGGTAGEFCIEWIHGHPVLNVHSGTWKVLHYMQDLQVLLMHLDGSDLSPEDLIKKLQEIGYQENR